MIHGGGECDSNKDCGNFGPDFDNPEYTGGKCEGGMCVCFEGYTCPHCTTKGNPEEVVKGDLKCSDSSLSSHLSFSFFLFIVILVVYLFCNVFYLTNKIKNVEN